MHGGWLFTGCVASRPCVTTETRCKLDGCGDKGRVLLYGAGEMLLVMMTGVAVGWLLVFTARQCVCGLELVCACRMREPWPPRGRR